MKVLMAIRNVVIFYLCQTCLTALQTSAGLRLKSKNHLNDPGNAKYTFYVTGWTYFLIPQFMCLFWSYFNLKLNITQKESWLYDSTQIFPWILRKLSLVKTYKTYCTYLKHKLSLLNVIWMLMVKLTAICLEIIKIQGLSMYTIFEGEMLIFCKYWLLYFTFFVWWNFSNCSGILDCFLNRKACVLEMYIFTRQFKRISQ